MHIRLDSANIPNKFFEKGSDMGNNEETKEKDMNRRQFFQSIGKLSKAVLGGVILAGSLTGCKWWHPLVAWYDGGGHWHNGPHPHWYNGGGGWHNGGGHWHNGGWHNGGGHWHNGGGGGWHNGGGHGPGGHGPGGHGPGHGPGMRP